MNNKMKEFRGHAISEDTKTYHVSQNKQIVSGKEIYRGEKEISSYGKNSNRKTRQRRKKRKARRRRVVVLGTLFLIIFLCTNRNLILVSFQSMINLGFVSDKKLEDMGVPESLIELYDRNEEARQFVLDYNKNKDKHETIDVSGDVMAGQIPLFLQWDERWGYKTYGDDFLAVTGCGPTVLSMVYVGLTGDKSLNPLQMAKIAEKNGYYVNGSGSSWNMMIGLAEQIGLSAKELTFDEDHIRSELSEGNPIICIMGPGDFTSSGHFIVLTGITENGEIEVKDPNSIKNSEKTWELDILMSQIRNLWRYEE